MAEALLRWVSDNRFETHSAGTEPSRVHPLAMKVMSEIDIDITVRDRANETYPVFPRAPERIQWSFPDPSAIQGADEERMRAFRAIRDELIGRLRPWVGIAERFRDSIA